MVSVAVEENYRIVVFFSACFRTILLNEMGVPKPMRFAKRRNQIDDVMKKIGMIEKDHLKREEMLNKPLQHMQELSTESCEMINGGSQSFLYWMAFGVGWVADKLGGLGG